MSAEFQGSDPNMMELIKKIQCIQKRLIAKSEEVIERELKLQEQDQLLSTMRAVLARCQKPNIGKKLLFCQHKLWDKTNKLKARLYQPYF